jgi:hypothetical protein
MEDKTKDELKIEDVVKLEPKKTGRPRGKKDAVPRKRKTKNEMKGEIPATEFRSAFEIAEDEKKEEANVA